MSELNVEQVLSDVTRALAEDLGGPLPNPPPLGGEHPEGHKYPEGHEGANVALRAPKAINDLTAGLIPATQTAHARVITREAAVIAGRPWFDACFRALDLGCVIDWRVSEGATVAAGAVLVEVSGNA